MGPHMVKYSANYCAPQYNAEQFREIVRRVAGKLPALLHKHDIDAIVVSGKSGICVAFAVQMLIDIPLVVVRKRGENTHGTMIEGREGQLVGRYAILDDFVASGDTVRRIHADLCKDAESWGNTFPELVRVFEYDSFVDGKFSRILVGDLEVTGEYI